jgi:hypothetical protein
MRRQAAAEDHAGMAGAAGSGSDRTKERIDMAPRTIRTAVVRFAFVAALAAALALAAYLAQQYSQSAYYAGKASAFNAYY